MNKTLNRIDTCEIVSDLLKEFHELDERLMKNEK